LAKTSSKLSKNMPKSLTPKKESRPRVVTQRFSGPIPPPALLNQYDVETRKVIVGMAQEQASHRQVLEKQIVQSNVSNERLGMWIAAIITIFMIGGGIYLVINDKNAVGFLLVFGTSIFQAGNYIYHQTKENDVDEEAKQTTTKPSAKNS
jgi:uncharacterized membrane protein